jgi:hypothetical protein
MSGREPREVGNVFKLGPAGEQAVATHARMPAIVQQAARAGANSSTRRRCGQDQVEDLFDDHYQPIPNTRPQKFKTRFDDFTDQAVVPLQEGSADPAQMADLCDLLHRPQRLRADPQPQEISQAADR